MQDFHDTPGAKEFEQNALGYLRGAVQRFFGGKVKYDGQPIQALRYQHGLDIAANKNRGVYLVDNDKCAVVLGRVLQGRQVTRVFSLQLTEARYTGLERLLNIFAAALASTLSHAATKNFDRKPHQFGNELIELTISKYFSKGYYDHRRFSQLTELFHSLCSARFEGRGFTTGVLLTKSHFALAGKGDQLRDGNLVPLAAPHKISPAKDIDKRFWYLVDGQSSFFVAGPTLEIRDLFLARGGSTRPISFVDDYTLSSTVRGGDVLFRVLSQSEFSITGSTGIDFNFKEGSWRMRNLAQISAEIQSDVGSAGSVVEGLLFYVFYLSRRRLSSILWMPRDTAAVDDVLMSRNRLTSAPLSLLEASHTQTLIRLLSSDGASVFSASGELLSYGSIVDISKIRIEGVKGTGESVASLLGKNGACLKVSQDGSVKLFTSGRDRPLLF